MDGAAQTAKRNRGASVALLLLLALPALPIMAPALEAGGEYRFALRPSGLLAAQLLLLALALGPLRALFPRAAWSAWLLRRRRAVGLAAFGYAALHLVFFVLSVGRLDYIVQGLAWASMWTGWLAFALLLPLAVTSSDAARRRLGPAWTWLHRLVHPAALLLLAHWLLLTRHAAEALLWFAPLAALLAARRIAAWRGRPGA